MSQSTFSDVRQKRMAGAVEGLPILYPPRSGRREVESDDDFNEFARALEVHTRREFGDIADIYKNLKYPRYAEVDYGTDDLLPGRKRSISTEQKNGRDEDDYETREDREGKPGETAGIWTDQRSTFY